jgi:serine/threonine protein kinase
MIGQKLGHNRIVEKIGEGGMGMVYRGEDEHLRRDVAIKILPPGSLADESERRRFRREALALSRLSHPNIEVVYDFDTDSGVDYLVMEYLRGNTLKQMLAGGELPEKDILRLGTQIAEGLAAAHAKGIVHCDLKPANIMVDAEGRIKILDFGLARLTQPEALIDTTTSSDPATRIAGTLPYMAPEQLKGELVDPRTDLYGFGNILYEMATGRLPFQEPLSTALANEILHKIPPPPGRLRPELSSRLEEIILKCLEKDPENRYQSAKEILVDLRRSSSREVSAVVVEDSNEKGRHWWLGALLVVVALMAVYGGMQLWISVETSRTIPSYESQEIVATPSCEEQPAMSPDGNYIAYVSGESSNQDIYVTDLREGRRSLIAGSPDADYEPAWIQSNEIAFTSERDGKPAIYRVNLLGGTPTLLIRNASQPAVSHDGTMIAFTRESPEGNLQLAVAPLADLGRVRTLTTEQDKTVRHLNPAWSPDGRKICYGRRSDLWVVPVAGGEPVRLTTDNERDIEPAWSPDGRHVYFCSYREGSYANGGLLAHATDPSERRITLLERISGQKTELSGEDSSMCAISPDKNKIVFVKNRGGSDVNLWIQELAGGSPSGLPWRLTKGPGFTAVPAFSPDGG